MGKIVNIQEFKSRIDKGNPRSKSLSYEATGRLIDKFELCSCMITELHLIIEEAISETGLNPGEFHMSQKAENEVLSLNISELFAGGEEALQMTFEAMINGTRYVAVGDAAISGEDISFDCIVVKWNGVEWLVYEDGSWVPGPGSDFI